MTRPARATRSTACATVSTTGRRRARCRRSPRDSNVKKDCTTVGRGYRVVVGDELGKVLVGSERERRTNRCARQEEEEEGPNELTQSAERGGCIDSHAMLSHVGRRLRFQRALLRALLDGEGTKETFATGHDSVLPHPSSSEQAAQTFSGSFQVSPGSSRRGNGVVLQGRAM